MTLAACSGLVVLLVAAIGKRNHELCKDYVISINGAQKNLFINENDIEKMLDATTGGKIKNERITGFNLRKLEQQLEENAWVQDANLYFDSKDVLHVSVREKEPIARIFTTAGKSFYIDANAEEMPLSGIMSARVPVFTGFPDKRFLSTKDSMLLNDIRKTASFILNDPFWMAQTEQIDITQDRNFEMVPTIGNHIVKLGNGDDIDKKFHRLFVFYQQVMSKTSFDKYKILDVQYTGQVIGTKEKISRVDSVQLRKNVQKLLQEAKKMQRDTVVALPVVQQKEIVEEQNASPGKDIGSKIDTREQNNSIPVKTTTTAKPKLIEKKAEQRKPKAVMPEKNR
jgi:cell division protein FtsQ